jgi:hypothetical protein
VLFRSEFWYKYDYYFFAQYRISPAIHSWDLLYYSKGSIDSIARLQLYPRIDTTMFGRVTAPLYRPIFIGHSMGGLVARQMVKALENAPSNTLDLGGGIITVGTPNFGADFIKSFSLPEADSILAHGRDELLAPMPLFQTPLTILSINLSGGLIDPFKITDSLTLQPISRVRLVAELSGAAGNFGLLEKCTQDMIPESPFMQSINDDSFPASVPRIGIYGAAKWQSHIRLLSSMTRQYPPSFSLDAAPDDYWVKEVASLSRGHRMTAMQAWSSSAAMQATLSYLPASVIGSVALRYFGNQCIRAANYLDYGSQIDWAALIKAQAIKTATYNAPIANSSSLDNPPAWQQQVTLTHFLVKENDGLLSRETQSLKGAQNQYRARGANHFTEGNHRSVRNSIITILNTESGFITLQRNP